MNTVTQQNEKTIEDRKQELKLTDENQTKILTSLYHELDEQGFTLSVYDGELFNSVSSLNDILNLYHDLDEMHIHVKKGDYKACASFIFGNGEDGVYCMYDYSYSLKNLIGDTLALVDTLANERCERRERIQIKEKERIVIKETIEYLIRNGFSIKKQNDSAFNMQEFLDLHSHLFEKNNGTGNGKVNGEEIFLKVIDADHDDGFISFMPSNGCYYVITNYSDHLSQYMNYTMCIMRSIA